jgi:Tfp pilus assembly protein PilO
MKFITFIVLVLISAAGFFFYVYPQYQAIQTLQTEQSQYTQALAKVSAAEKTRDDLITRYNSFSSADLARLQVVMPQNINSIRLLVDITQFAASDGVKLTNISTQSDAESNPDAVSSAGSAYNTLVVRFTIHSSYDQFLQFLRDTEHSMPLLDVTSITFTPADSGVEDFQVTLKTYSLN